MPYDLSAKPILSKVEFVINRLFVSLLISAFFGALFFFNPKSVFAATYYVRADGSVLAASKASATSPNSASTALNLAQMNAASFAAGDQILFSSQGGNYTAKPVLPSGGSGVGTEITYANVPSETPLFAITSGDTLDTNSKSNIIVQGLTLNYTGGSATSNIGVLITAGSNIQFKNINSDMGGFGYNFFSSAILSNVVFDTVTVTHCRSSNQICLILSGSSNSNITINSLTATNGVVLDNVSTGAITNSSFTSAGTLTINTGSSITVSNISSIGGVVFSGVTTSTVSHVTASGGIGFPFTNSSNISVSDSSDTNSILGGGFYSAFDAIGASHDITYNRDTAVNSAASGFTARDTSYNITYNNCTSDNNNNIGFLASISAHDITYWYDEASYNGQINVTTDGAGFLPHNAATNVKCYYCIAHHNYTVGIGDVSTGTNLFYNSVSWANGYAIGDTFKGGTVVTASTRGNLYVSGSKSGGMITIKNTISGQGKPRELVNATPQYMTYDNNLYYPITNNTFSSTDEVNNSSWSTYHAAYESNSLNGNPLFTNASIYNFTLQPTSPAINVGTNLSLTQDFIGTAVPQGSAPDLGAYEFLLTAPPSSLAQYKSDGITAIPSGTFVADTTSILKMSMTSTNSADLLTPQVEIQPIGTAFTNTVTNSGVAVAFSGSPVTGSVTVTGLTSGTTYHWQSRTSNPAGLSAWVSKGGNPDFGVDTTAPSGSISINNGASSVRGGHTVTLSLSAADNVDTTASIQMQISNDPNLTNAPWEAFSTSKNWTLTQGDGDVRVYARFKDSLGNISSPYSYMINLDSTPPSTSSPNSSYSAPSCNAQAPSSAPELFQLNAGKTEATLYFVPSSGQRDRYIVSYGTTDSQLSLECPSQNYLHDRNKSRAFYRCT